MEGKRKIWHWLILGALSLRIIIAFLCLFPIAVRNLPKLNKGNILSIVIIGFFGSAIALALFYMLIKDTSPVFASMVTYFVPIAATFWGLADGERLTSSMLVSILLILGGVYLINRPGFRKKIKFLFQNMQLLI
jgi:drug/metabolite transporter (DMT)-like permease